jgi:hypothetical protein
VELAHFRGWKMFQHWGSHVMPGFSLEVSVGEMYGCNHENRWN